MKKITYILVTCLLVSCEHEEFSEGKLTNLQAQAIKELSIGSQALFEDCYPGMSFRYCFESAVNRVKQPCQSTATSNGSSVLSTATGVAVGIGASNLLFGRKK